MSDEICEQWEDCDDNRMNMSCMRIIYDYCETSSHCSNDPYETPETVMMTTVNLLVQM